MLKKLIRNITGKQPDITKNLIENTNKKLGR